MRPPGSRTMRGESTGSWRAAVAATLADIRTASRGRIAVYVIIPAVLAGVLLGMYFSGNLALQRVVSPKLPPLPIDSWRELGLLENLQIVLVLAMLVVAVTGAARQRGRRERMFFGIVACVAAFVLLEEIDYGSHYRHYLAEPNEVSWRMPENEWPPGVLERSERPVSKHGLHYWNKIEERLKILVNALVGFLFVWLPVAARRRRGTWAARLAPDPLILCTVLIMIMARYAAHGLGWLDARLVAAAAAAGGLLREAGSINSNLSEFGELLVYYTFLVYVIRMARLPAHGTARSAVA